ncbi:MAG TPA: low affinity iron permease family protein [Thermoanaerobaculia bacterium]|nr:low affinity iron permease family protein [Thermoanaerobaculia bacterium]
MTKHPEALKPSGAKDQAPDCGLLERCSLKVTEWAGSTWAFAVAVAVILVWAVTGPFFHYSDTWQLVINTGTTIVTFLMVFLIQRAQNKESKAVQLKLNEIVAAVHGASNRLIDVENLSEAEIARLQEHFRNLSEVTRKEGNLRASHSIEEAEQALGKKRESKTKRASAARG